MPASAIRRKPKSRWKVLAVAAILLLLLVGWLGTANYLAWAVMTNVQSLEALAKQPLDTINLNLARSIVRQTRQDTDPCGRWPPPCSGPRLHSAGFHIMDQILLLPAI